MRVLVLACAMLLFPHLNPNQNSRGPWPWAHVTIPTDIRNPLPYLLGAPLRPSPLARELLTECPLACQHACPPSPLPPSYSLPAYLFAYPTAWPPLPAFPADYPPLKANVCAPHGNIPLRPLLILGTTGLVWPMQNSPDHHHPSSTSPATAISND